MNQFSSKMDEFNESMKAANEFKKPEWAEFLDSTIFFIPNTIDDIALWMAFYGLIFPDSLASGFKILKTLIGLVVILSSLLIYYFSKSKRKISIMILSSVLFILGTCSVVAGTYTQSVIICPPNFWGDPNQSQTSLAVPKVSEK